MNSRGHDDKKSKYLNQNLNPTSSFKSDSDLDSAESGSSITRKKSGSRLSGIFKKSDKKHRHSHSSRDVASAAVTPTGSLIASTNKNILTAGDFSEEYLNSHSTNTLPNESSRDEVSAAAHDTEKKSASSQENLSVTSTEAELDNIVLGSSVQNPNTLMSKLLHRKHDKKVQKEKNAKKQKNKKINTVVLEDGTEAQLEDNVITPIENMAVKANVLSSSSGVIKSADDVKSKQSVIGSKKNLLSRILHREAPTLPEVNQLLMPVNLTPRHDAILTVRSSPSPRSEKSSYSPHSDEDLVDIQGDVVPAIAQLHENLAAQAAVTKQNAEIKQQAEMAIQAQQARAVVEKAKIDAIKKINEENKMNIGSLKQAATVNEPHRVSHVREDNTARDAVEGKESNPLRHHSASVLRERLNDDAVTSPVALTPRSRVKELPAPSLAHVQFAKTATNKFNTFKDHVVSVSAGKTALSSSWGEWLGMTMISSGFALVGGAVGVVAAFGLIGGPLAAGIALGVSLLGVGVTIGYSVILGQLQRRQFKRAANFIDSDGLYYENNVDALINTLSIVLNKQLLNSSRHDANLIAKASIDVVKYLIMNGKVKSFDELHSEDKLRGLLSKYANKGKDYQLDISMDAKSKTTSDILRGLSSMNVPDMGKESRHARSKAYNDPMMDDASIPLLAKTKSTPTFFTANDRRYGVNHVQLATVATDSEPMLAKSRRL